MDTYEQAITDREALAKFHSPLTDGKSIHDDGMFEEFVTDTPTDLDNAPVSDRLDTIQQRIIDVQSDVTELLDLLRPLGPFIAALPELMEKIDPLMEGIKSSPITRMMGIRIP